jgi:hypothetical protein
MPRGASPAPVSPLMVSGTPGERIVLVLDPEPEPVGDLPDRWQEIAGRFEVHWCRLAEAGGYHAGQYVLADVDDPLPRVDIIAAGPAADEAFRLAGSRPSAVRSVLLVNPAAKSARTDQEWFTDRGSDVAVLRDAGVEVDVIQAPSAAPRHPLRNPALAPHLEAALDRLPAVRRADS